MLVIKLVNDGTGTEVLGHYDVTVAVNDKTIWQGRIEGHRRSKGWKRLVQRLAWALELEED